MFNVFIVMDVKYKKEILEDLILNQKKSYRSIGLIYGVSDTYIKKISKKLGIKLPIRANFKNGFSNIKKGEKIICLCCGNEIIKKYKRQLYCNKVCYLEHKKYKHYFYYLNNQDKFCDTLNTKDMRLLKNKILDEQKNCCKICNIENDWNGKKLVFILDHIDGNAANNKKNNLRLICPNCDSQLDTYKSKNKNSARKERYLKNYK